MIHQLSASMCTPSSIEFPQRTSRCCDCSADDVAQRVQRQRVIQQECLFQDVIITAQRICGPAGDRGWAWVAAMVYSCVNAVLYWREIVPLWRETKGTNKNKKTSGRCTGWAQWQ